MKKELLVILCSSVLLFGCGGGSGSINDQDRDLDGDNNSTRSDYGIYALDSEAEVVPFSVILSKNGIISVGYNNGGLSLSGFSLVGTDGSSINHDFYLSDDTGAVRYKASLQLESTGQSTGDVLPYTLKIPHFNVDESGLVIYGKTEGHTGGDELLDKAYSIPTNDMFYTYNGNNTFTITGQQGCTTTAKALNSGLGNPEQMHYDVLIKESTCETDDHSTGLLTIMRVDSVHTLGIVIQLKNRYSGFAGIAM